MNDDNITVIIVCVTICLMIAIIFRVGMVVGYNTTSKVNSPAIYQDVTINGVQYRAIQQGDNK